MSLGYRDCLTNCILNYILLFNKGFNKHYVCYNWLVNLEHSQTSRLLSTLNQEHSVFGETETYFLNGKPSKSLFVACQNVTCDLKGCWIILVNQSTQSGFLQGKMAYWVMDF